MSGRSDVSSAAADVQTRTTAASPVEVSADVAVDEWNNFVRGHGQATGYHLWEWRHVFERAHKHRTYYLAARQGGHVTGVLPLVEVSGPLFGRALSSLPYVNYGGVLAEDQIVASALVEHARRLAAARRLSYVLLRHRHRQFADLPTRAHKITMVLALEHDRDSMWAGLDRKVRNQIRKAEKSGVTVESGSSELLDEFYGVFARNMRDLGTPVYGRALFASILAAFPGDARLHIARVEGKTVAGALSYAYGTTIEVPSASSLREYRALCPNHALYWSIMSEAIAHGRRTFDFGRSTPDDGTHHFKAQWGAVAEPLTWEYLLIDETPLPKEDRHSSKYQLLITAWQRLPVGIATRVGPWIARAVP